MNWYNDDMEIYRGTVPKVYFDKPTAATTVTDAKLVVGDTTTSLPTPVNESATVASVTLPYQQFEGTVKVAWTFNIPGSGSFTEEHTYEVVTPLLTNREIKKIHPDATEEEVTRIEKATRHIIAAHTGQTFGKFVGTKTVRGNGSRALFLPQRLITLNTVNGQTADANFYVDADGWILYYFPWGVPPVKADYFGLHMHTGGVIHNPNNVRLGDWQDSRGYEINGTWGWLQVPAQVVEAAKLLVNDYACAEQTYRDRYLTSMTAADWRIQFHSGAFRETGNVRADQLLNDYVLKRGWAAV